MAASMMESNWIKVPKWDGRVNDEDKKGKSSIENLNAKGTKSPKVRVHDGNWGGTQRLGWNLNWKILH